MGRNIPSVTYRLNSKIVQWEKFKKLLNGRERDAFDELIRKNDIDLDRYAELLDHSSEELVRGL